MMGKTKKCRACGAELDPELVRRKPLAVYCNLDCRTRLHPNAKLTPEKVQMIRSLYGKLPNNVIALRFGVSAPTVSQVANRRLWKQVP